MSKFDHILNELKEKNKNAVPQTVEFKATFHYDRLPKTRESEEFTFACFETMIFTYRKARTRRSIADRPTSGTYETVLTDLGEKMVQKCASSRKSHADVVGKVNNL